MKEKEDLKTKKRKNRNLEQDKIEKEENRKIPEEETENFKNCYNTKDQTRFYSKNEKMEQERKNKKQKGNH